MLKMFINGENSLNPTLIYLKVFVRTFNDPATYEAMSEDKITGGVEMFVLDETFEL